MHLIFRVFPLIEKGIGRITQRLGFNSFANRIIPNKKYWHKLQPVCYSLVKKLSKSPDPIARYSAAKTTYLERAAKKSAKIAHLQREYLDNQKSHFKT